MRKSNKYIVVFVCILLLTGCKNASTDAQINNSQIKSSEYVFAGENFYEDFSHFLDDGAKKFPLDKTKIYNWLSINSNNENTKVKYSKNLTLEKIKFSENECGNGHPYLELYVDSNKNYINLDFLQKKYGNKLKFSALRGAPGREIHVYVVTYQKGEIYFNISYARHKGGKLFQITFMNR